jgi:UDP-N-acetylglucosamine--N-acetylmuramyl-(pentapeptide) pyrophosphoryl-undecaprenol N-acetylglucosamine transferase
MKVIISGGGTGGHIYPALSIADNLINRDKKTQILYIGTASGLESSLVPERGYEFRAIRVKGFRRSLSTETVKSVIELIKGMGDAKRIIREYKPDIVVGTGGYVAGPVLMVAFLRGVPTLIHEQNVLPGVTNRILSHFVGCVAVSFEEAVMRFKSKEKVVVTGNPIRTEITRENRTGAIKKLGLSDKSPIVVSFGGSKGSDKLNTALVGVIEHLVREGGFQLLHATGQDRYDGFMAALKSRNIKPEGCGDIKIMPYLHQMPEALAAADLVITSAGAITIAEITAIGLPAVLIPKSHAVDNHQEYNARALERKGAAVVLTENELKGDRLYKQVSGLIKNKTLLSKMKQASKKMEKADAAEKICDIIVEMVKR